MATPGVLTKNKQTKLVRERRVPLVLPRDQDIALVKARSPAVYAALIDAARETGAREDDLIRAKIALRSFGRKVRMPKRMRIALIWFTIRVCSVTRLSRSRFGRLASSSSAVGIATMLQ